MVKITPAVYEDPGNPFADELEAERAARKTSQASHFSYDKPLPVQPIQTSSMPPRWIHFSDQADPFARKFSTANSDCSRSVDKPLPLEPDEVSPTSPTFQFEDKESGSDEEAERDQRPESSFFSGPRMVHAPKASRVGTPEAIRRAHHRSMSLALPPSSGRPDSDEYVSPRKLWRRENSLPVVTSQLEKVEEGDGGGKSARDTRFYGFYEDLIKGYDKRRSRP